MNFQDQSIKAIEKKARRDAARASAFQEFMSNPSTKLAITMIPTSETAPEALQVLLDASFQAGYKTGSGDVAGEMIEAIISGMEKSGRPDRF